jgi:peptidoglycan/LPS O-acetylase OafA/YrhL
MSQRIQRLDTLRAVAISMVFLAHSVLGYGPTFLLHPLQTGGIGVDLFFALSGWLIGSQLFKEIGKTGNVDVKRFLVRRWFRTVPAYYAVLLLTVMQLYLFKDAFEFPISYIFFAQNYFAPLPFLSITWSLCVEEQFYLIIAPLLFMFRRRSAHTILAILLLMLFAPTLFRWLELYGNKVETHVSWDCCIMGVTLAFVHLRLPSLWNHIVKLNQLAFPFLTALLIAVIVSKYTENYYFSTPSKLVLAAIFGSWVVWANTENHPSRTNEKATAIAKYVASRSYSIYLLHPEALAIASRVASDSYYPVFFLVALAITLCISELLYKFVEMPFMNMREKFHFSQSAAFAPGESRAKK